jgi:hypothetical protein
MKLYFEDQNKLLTDVHLLFLCKLSVRRYEGNKLNIIAGYLIRRPGCNSNAWPLISLASFSLVEVLIREQ